MTMKSSSEAEPPWWQVGLPEQATASCGKPWSQPPTVAGSVLKSPPMRIFEPAGEALIRSQSMASVAVASSTSP